jgi:LysM repeat protein
MTYHNHYLFVVVTPLVLFLDACSQPTPAVTPTANSSEANGAASATVGDLVGQVQGKRVAIEALAPITLGFLLERSGEVQTGDASKARLDFDDGSIVRVAPNSTFVFQDAQLQGDGTVLAHLQLTFGKLWVSLTGGEVQVETPVGVATVRGSFALFQYDPNTRLLRVDCLEGTCTARNQIVNAQLGNLERIVLGEQNSLRQPLTEADVQSFLQENPESGRLVATLTAAPPATATPANATPTATVSPTATLGLVAGATTTTATRALPLITSSPTLGVAILGTHVVRGNETLNCIGRGYGVLPAAIASANGINAAASLTVGQSLRIPAVRWTSITPGPICTPQFTSPFPGLATATATATAIATTTATTTATPTATQSPTPSATPSITPTSTPTIDAPVFSNLQPAQPLVIDDPQKCAVTFSADIAYSQSILAANVEWPIGPRPNVAQMSLSKGDRFSGTWTTTVFITMAANSSVDWQIMALDSKENVYRSAPGAVISTTATVACFASR